MLDICFPVYSENIEAAITAVHGIQAHTLVPYRVIACVDGDCDTHRLELELRAMGDPCTGVKLLKNKRTLYEAETVARCFDEVENNYVAIVPGNVSLEDKKWFDKLWRPFQQDSVCMLTSNQPAVLATAVRPFKISKKDVIDANAIVVLQRRILKTLGWRFPNVDLFLAQKLVDEIHKIGGSCWAVPGMRAISLKGEQPPMISRNELDIRRGKTQVEVVL